MTYANHPRLLQVWHKPADNRVITFPSLDLADGTRLERSTSIRVRLPVEAGEVDLVVEQGKRGRYPRLTYTFTEFSGGV